MRKTKRRFGKEKSVYLTFDDGPETGITEFVVETLEKYGCKATFFCVGQNYQEHPDLINLIQSKGHSIGSHTFHHVNGFDLPEDEYIKEVEEGARITNSVLFRPPWGALKIHTYYRLNRLSKKYSIVYWNLLSGDTELGKFDLEKAFLNLRKGTTHGKVVLFHFCHLHEKETRQILPPYLDYLKQIGYTTEAL